jgi:hypothetical protein
MPNSTTQPVTITNNNGATAVNPNQAVLSIRNADEVKWQGAANFTVNFDQPEGSPFSQSQFSGGPGNPALSGPPTNGTSGTTYKYTAQIADATALDPTIKTDP